VDVTIVLSILFLLAPVLGYVVILLPMEMRTKIQVAAVGMLFMVIVPILVMLVTGS
jgi:hypothetical protein